MIGLATEAHAARKDSKAAKAVTDNESTHDDASQSNVSLLRTQSSRPPKTTTQHATERKHEYNHTREADIAQFGIPDEPPPPYPSIRLEGHVDEKDEADWQLDDAVEDEEDERALEQQSPDTSSTFDPGPVPSSKEGRQHYVDKIVQAFLASHPPPADSLVPRGQLPCPVIIPQRRPHDKKRGFVRAYASVLEPCGVDQDSFLGFLKAMHLSSKASPVFNVINIAAMIAGVAPSITAMIVSTVVQAAALAAIEFQGNLRTNDFLAQINEKYFRPRGLVCLIFKFKPEDAATHEAVDISSTILKTINPASSRFKQTINNAGRASGRTIGDLEMPQAAPLVFPALDDLHARDAPKTRKENMKRKGKFVANYFDKRAQATYTAENPNSVLANANTQEHRFASRFADPNHPVNSGHPIALLTGGIINPKSRELRRRGGLGSMLNGGRPSDFDYNSPQSRFDGRHHGHGRNHDHDFHRLGSSNVGGLGRGPLSLIGGLASMAISRSQSDSSLEQKSNNRPTPYGGLGTALYTNHPRPYGELGHDRLSSNPPTPYSGFRPAPHGSSYSDYGEDFEQAETLRQRELDLEERERRLDMGAIEGRVCEREINRYPTTATQSPSRQNKAPGGLLKRMLNQVCLSQSFESCFFLLDDKLFVLTLCTERVVPYGREYAVGRGDGGGEGCACGR